MKIKSIEILKFKNIKESGKIFFSNAPSQINNITIIGKNNTGKSNLLEILRFAIDIRKWRDKCKTLPRDTHFSITYNDLSFEEKKFLILTCYQWFAKTDLDYFKKICELVRLANEEEVQNVRSQFSNKDFDYLKDKGSIKIWWWKTPDPNNKVQKHILTSNPSIVINFQLSSVRGVVNLRPEIEISGFDNQRQYDFSEMNENNSSTLTLTKEKSHQLWEALLTSSINFFQESKIIESKITDIQVEESEQDPKIDDNIFDIYFKETFEAINKRDNLFQFPLSSDKINKHLTELKKTNNPLRVRVITDNLKLITNLISDKIFNIDEGDYSLKIDEINLKDNKSIRFNLERTSADGEVIEEDFYHSSTGFKKFIKLKLTLLRISIENNHILIIDEPELHLHSDWEYDLIRTLEDLKITYIIVTHSLISTLGTKTRYIELEPSMTKYPKISTDKTSFSEIDLFNMGLWSLDSEFYKHLIRERTGSDEIVDLIFKQEKKFNFSFSFKFQNFLYLQYSRLLEGLLKKKLLPFKEEIKNSKKYDDGEVKWFNLWGLHDLIDTFFKYTVPDETLKEQVETIESRRNKIAHLNNKELSYNYVDIINVMDDIYKIELKSKNENTTIDKESKN